MTAFSRKAVRLLFQITVPLLCSLPVLGQTITGRVFRDFNGDGTYVAIPSSGTYAYGEPGVGGVTITAYNTSGAAVATTTSSTLTSSLGAYTLTVGNTNAYRIEFTNLLTGDYEGAQGTNNASSVQFVNGGATNVNYGINYPGNYCQTTTPNLVTTCFLAVNATNSPAIETQPALVGLPYTGEDGTATVTDYATEGEVGAAWGIAYKKDSKQLFSSAFTKRHVGFAAGGPNAIYVTTVTSTTSGNTTEFFNFTTVGGSAVTSTTEAHGNDLPTPTTGSPTFAQLASHDNPAFDAVGKTSLGDIELSEDGKTLYVVNLKDRKLYSIDVATKTATGVLIPNPGCTTSGTAVNGSYRPFALKTYRGKIYVGVVCTREDLGSTTVAYGSTPGLSATVYEVDPAAPTVFSTVLSFPLTYFKQPSNADKTGQARAEYWRPWTSVFQADRTDNPYSYPQAWLTGIEFEPTTGDMLVGLRDRFGDQIGFQNYLPFTTATTLISAISPGEILRARKCNPTDATWTLESGGALCSTPTSTTQAAQQGPGDGKFYWGDRVQNGANHGTSSQGALAQLSGNEYVAMTSIDPTDQFNTGGIKRLDNLTGAKDGNTTGTNANPAGGVVLYGSNPLDYGKANGLGDLEVLCNPAPIEIGNRVWNDTNSNGIQDAGETGIAGVSVTLVTANGTPIATATTNTNGNYYFSSATGTTSTTAVYSLTALTANTAYSLKFPTTSGGKSLMASNAAADNIDSDPSAAGVVSFTMAGFGANNHSFDAGYGSIPCSLTATATPTSCNSATNQYSVSGTISLTSATAGTATITDGTVSTTVSIATGATAVAYSLTGITSDAQSHTVVVNLPGCGTATVAYTAPASCTAPAICSINLTPTVSGCYSVSGVSKATVSVEVAWQNAPANADLVVSTGGQSVTITPGSFTVTYPQPTTVVIQGRQNIVTPQVVAFELTLAGASSLSNVTAYFTGNTSCSATTSYTLPAACPPAPCNNGQLGGTVYRDFNADGVQQPGETQGVSSMTVTAYDCNGVKYGPVVTDQFGRYTFTSSGITYPVRVEFSAPTGIDIETVYGANSKSSVQFVAQATCSVDLGIANSSLYCQSNPQIFVPCYTYGDPLNITDPVATSVLSASADALVTLPYDESTTNASGSVSHLEKAGVLGTVWGLGYNRYTKDLFLSAVAHRHAGLGPLGLGGIYVTHTGSASATTESFIDVASIGVDVGTVLPNGTGGRGLSADKTKPSYDSDIFAKIGKVGIGGLEIGEDGQSIWFVNLFDKKLYSLNISQYNLNKANKPTAADVSSYAIPDPGCSSGESRPWALHVYGGKMYVGTVCDAINSKNKSDMRAYVYAFDLASKTFNSTPIFDFPLTYPKGYGISPLNSAGQAGADSTGWFPWTDNFQDLVIQTSPAGNKSLVHPQPILSDIDFDIDGSLVLAFADRTGLQGGWFNYSTDPTDTQAQYKVNPAAGDVLRAYYSGGTYILENNGKVGPYTGTGVDNNQGPGFGEFYNDNYFDGTKYAHTELALGGLALRPGSGHVVGTTIDPVTAVANSGGIKYWDNTNGKAVAAANVYTSAGSATNNSTFGKASGLGEPELNCDLLNVIEIGNRVWLDSNKDGIQDPCEKSLAGVLVALYQSNTLVATTTTDANGEYYFNNNPTSSTATNVASTTAILANTTYTVRFGTDGTTNQYDNTTQVLTLDGGKYNVTVPFATAPNASTINDSNAQLAGGFLSATVTTGAGGSVNHSIDAGFVCVPTTVASVSVVPATCPVSGSVANSNGQILLTGIQCADKVFLVTAGSAIPSYTATSGQPVSNSATSFTGLANPATSAGQSYSLVLYNGPCCYTVVTATLPQTVCVQPALAVAVSTPVCNSATNQYVATGTVSLTNVPASATLTITDNGVIVSSQTLTAGQSTASFSVSGVSNGPASRTVIATLTGSGTYASTTTYSVPAACTVCSTSITTTGLAPAQLGAAYSQTISASGGSSPYTFSLAAGSLPVGLTLTTSGIISGTPITAGTNSFTVLVTDAKSCSDSQPFTLSVVTASLGDYVFEDVNANGIQELTDKPIAGVTVTLLSSGTVVGTTTTNNSGLYSFTGLTPGVPYSVSFTAPAGFTGTVQNAQGSTNANDSNGDPATGLTAPVTLTANENNPTIDMGYYKPASLGDYVFADNNKNGIQDNGDTPIPGVSVTLLASGTVVATTTTNASGLYSFTGLTPGVPYSVSFATPAGYTATTPMVGNDPTIDSNPDQGLSTPVSLTSGENNPTIDAGFYLLDIPAIQSVTVCAGSPATLVMTGCSGSVTWNGPNIVSGASSATLTVSTLASSTQQVVSYTATCSSSNTALVATVTVSPVPVISPSSLPVATVGSPYSQTLTGSNGSAPYSFSLTGGSLPAGLTLTTSGVLSGTPTNSAAASFTVTMTDSKGCVANQPYTSSAVTASLGDYVFEDVNANGIQELTDKPIAGVTVTLLSSGTVVGTTITNNSGLYSFTGLTPGVPYSVSFTAPTGYTATQANVGTDDAKDSDGDPATGLTAPVTLTANENNPTIDMGYYKPASLGDYVFADNNKNGIQDNGDTPIPGVSVTLLASGTVVTTTTTNASGLYSFTGLTPGVPYSVSFATPAGYTATTPTVGNDPTVDSNPVNGVSAPVSLTSGENNPTIDAGFYAVSPSLSLTKQVDKSKAYQGDVLTYTLVIANTGNAAATNVIVRDSLSLGLHYVANSASAPTGTTFAQGTLSSTWSVASLSAGQSVSLTLQAVADSAGILYNTATIPGDTAKVCTSVPFKVCKGTDFLIQLTAPSGRSSYQWFKDGAAITGATSNTLNVTAPGTYSLAVDNQTGQCTDFSCCPLIVEEDTLPTYKAVAIPATCIGNAPQANGQLVISNFRTGYTYQYSLGSTFNEAASLSGTAKVIPANGIIATSLANPATAQAYTVRVYNAAGCYQDVTVLLVPTVCDCPASICVPFVIKQTKGPKRGNR